jgi:hypothetical protein
MRSLKLLLTSCIALMLFTFSQCKKNKTEEPQLPPETTIGAMTFGCKVNGKVFVPRDGRGKPGLFVQYVNMGTGPGGGWYLNITATNWIPNPPEGINITTDSLLVVEGFSYEFKYDVANNSTIKGTAFSGYGNGRSGYIKTNSDTGSLRIIKFDKINRILSGTFSYSATNLFNGDKIHINDGRFDIRY